VLSGYQFDEALARRALISADVMLEGILGYKVCVLRRDYDLMAD
jgi:hypothetical protein